MHRSLPSVGRSASPARLRCNASTVMKRAKPHDLGSSHALQLTGVGTFADRRDLQCDDVAIVIASIREPLRIGAHQAQAATTDLPRFGFDPRGIKRVERFPRI